jgi:phosphopentomutase
MPVYAKSAFPHRRNRNGSHDSICTTCLATLASAMNEDELVRYEAIHVCDPIRLVQLHTRLIPPFLPVPHLA